MSTAISDSAAAALPDPDWPGGHSAGALRDIRAVIVAADSAVGLVAQAIDDLSAHLPPQHAQRVCPLCSTRTLAVCPVSGRRAPCARRRGQPR